MYSNICPGIPTTIQTIGVNITTVAYLRVLIIGIGSTINFNGGGSPGCVVSNHVAPKISKIYTYIYISLFIPVILKDDETTPMAMKWVVSYNSCEEKTGQNHATNLRNRWSNKGRHQNSGYLVVWIPRIPFWKALLHRGIPRIPNHRAPNTN